jgi:hypothetical protein
MSPYECCVQVKWGVFKDQEYRLLDVEHIIELDQILVICLLQELDLPQGKEWDAISVLCKVNVSEIFREVQTSVNEQIPLTLNSFILTFLMAT